MLFEQIGDKVVPVSSIIAGQSVEPVDARIFLEAKSRFSPIEMPAIAPSAELFSLGSGYFAVFPNIPEFTEPLASSLIKVFERVHVSTLSSLQALDTWDDSKTISLTEFSHSSMFSSLCLFIIDAGTLGTSLAATCPHAVQGSIARRAGRFLTKILGASGIAFMISDTRYLCAHYSHAQGDPELLAIQSIRALQRGLAVQDASAFKPGPRLTMNPTSHEAESEILSFIDAL